MKYFIQVYLLDGTIIKYKGCHDNLPVSGEKCESGECASHVGKHIKTIAKELTEYLKDPKSGPFFVSSDGCLAFRLGQVAAVETNATH